MKKFALSKYYLAVSFLLFASGVTLVFFYLSRSERIYSLETTLRENFTLKLMMVLTGLLPAIFNMANVYLGFSDKMSLKKALKLTCLNFPLLVLQLLFVYGFFVLNAYL